MNAFLLRHFFREACVWEPRERLLQWGHGSSWTIGRSYEGSLHLGASGSGKTSGGIRAQGLAVMRDGYGVLGLFTTEAGALKLQQFQVKLRTFAIIGLVVAWQAMDRFYPPLFAAGARLVYLGYHA